MKAKYVAWFLVVFCAIIIWCNYNQGQEVMLRSVGASITLIAALSYLIVTELQSWLNRRVWISEDMMKDFGSPRKALYTAMFYDDQFIQSSFRVSGRNVDIDGVRYHIDNYAELLSAFNAGKDCMVYLRRVGKL